MVIRSMKAYHADLSGENSKSKTIVNYARILLADADYEYANSLEVNIVQNAGSFLFDVWQVENDL